MAGVFFNLIPKRSEGDREPAWKAVLTSSLDESLNALSDGVKEQKPKYLAAISRMEDLRSRIATHWGKTNAVIENTDTFINEVLRPYMQLVSDTKLYFTLPPEELPDNAGKLIAQATSSTPVKFLAFSWKCAFASNVTILSGNVNVELLALLFNLAVLLFNQATATMYQSAEPESCKTAFRQFQNAAGVFEQAREMSENEIPQSQLSFDMYPATLEVLRELSLGMAHRCAYIKACAEPATKDNLALLSKLAVTGAKHLREKCLDRLSTLAEGRSINDTFKQLQMNIGDNAALLEGDGYLHMMHIDYKANQTGICIAKGRVAMAILSNQATNHCASAFNRDWLNAKCAEIRALHDDAAGFNNSVYFKTIPTGIEPLPSMDRALAKPTPIFSSDFSDCDQHSEKLQPFKGLVGPEIIPLLQSFREQITAEYGRLSRTVTQKRNEASEALSSLELDALLCQSEEGAKPQIPESLRDKVRKIQNQAASYEHGDSSSSPGQEPQGKMTPAQMLQSMLRYVANICAAVEPVCAEAAGLLDKDTERDNTYVHTYGEKLWRSRVRPGNDLPDFPTFRKRIAEVRNVVNKEARDVLQGIVKTLNENAQPLLRVGMPLEDLDALIPVSAAPTNEQQAANDARSKLRELRANFESVNETELSLLRAIPPLISSPETAAALCGSKKENREDILAKKQVEFIDQFSGVTALSDQRQGILDEMEKVVLELAKVESGDPLLKEKASLMKSIERGILVVEGAVMRISDLSMQVSNMMEVANSLKQSCASLVAAREIEAKNVCTQLDQQLQEQMKRLEQQKQAEEAIRMSQQISSAQQQQNQQNHQQPIHLNMQNLQQQQNNNNSSNNNFAGSSSSPSAGSPNSNPMFHMPSSGNFMMGSPTTSNSSNSKYQQQPQQQSNVNQLPAEMFGGFSQQQQQNNNNQNQNQQNNNNNSNSYAPPSFADPFSAGQPPPPPPPPPSSNYNQNNNNNNQFMF